MENLCVWHLNTCTLRNKIDDINQLLESTSLQPKIFALTETRISDFEKVFYQLHGYNFILNARKNQSGGGVGIYYSDNLQVWESQGMFNSFENISISTRIGELEVSIVVIYRPP